MVSVAIAQARAGSARVRAALPQTVAPGDDFSSHVSLGARMLFGCAREEGLSDGKVTTTATAADVARGEPLEMPREQLAERLRLGDPSTHVFDANPRAIYEKRHAPGARWIPYDGVTGEMLPAHA